MLDQTRDAIATAAGARVALAGSSLGAFVALHAADADTTGRVDRLILMAPALDFGGNRLRQLGEHGIDEWRRRGRLEVFHYALNRPAEVGFELYEDAARYDAWAVEVRWPTLVFQGTRDASVDPAMVTRWASSQPAVDLRLYDDDHQLTASVDTIWRESARFMELADRSDAPGLKTRPPSGSTSGI
jgi:alpha-beta hydrolase superfamily lysophospholipase